MRFKKLKSLWHESYFIITKHNMSCMSAQLTYAVIVAIVPFLAVIFSFIHSRKNFSTVVDEILHPFIINNFGEKVGTEISHYIDSIILNIQFSELGIISLISFLVTVILLLLLLESVFNTLLDARAEKNYFISLLKCWLLLVFSPFLFVLITVRSQFLLTLLNLTKHFPINVGTNILSFVIGYLSQVLFFSLLFYIMPSRRPHFKAALLGGLITTIVLNILGYINIYLVKTSFTADSSQLYGSVPLIAILFFVWVRLVIYVIMIGFVFTTASERVALNKTKFNAATKKA